MLEEEPIPGIFQDYFEESGVLDPLSGEEEMPWNEQLQKKLEGLGYKIVAWKEVGERAVAGVIANKYCVDAVAYVIDGPVDFPRRFKKGELFSWQLLKNQRNLLPGVVAYNRWGTNFANCDTPEPELERFKDELIDAEEFINDLIRYQEWSEENWGHSLPY